MADYTFDQFPIEADEIDIEAMQEEITALQQKLNTLTARTINGLDLTEDRVLKSAQFAEDVTGEKMLANLLYSQVSSWDSGAKKSIKLEGDTYIDYSGVTIDNKGTTLKTRIDKINYGNLSTNVETVASEADINAIIYGTTVMSTTTSFSLGGVNIPGYSRLLKINYYSNDGALIGITPSRELIVAFRNNGTWTARIL